MTYFTIDAGTAADIGFHGAERRAHGKSVPGYAMLLGDYVGEERIEFGERATRLPTRVVPETGPYAAEIGDSEGAT